MRMGQDTMCKNTRKRKLTNNTFNPEELRSWNIPLNRRSTRNSKQRKDKHVIKGTNLNCEKTVAPTKCTMKISGASTIKDFFSGKLTE